MKTEDWLTLSVIYRTKSLSSAAKELFISQPALTIRLQNIEKEVGCQIAIRSNKGLLFTPEGEYLSTQSQKIMDLVNETLRHVQGTSNEDIGIIKIVAPSTIAKYFLPALLLQYKKLSPETTFRLEVVNSSEVERAITSCKAYCGFVHGDYCENLPRLPLSTMRAYAVCKQPLTLEELKEMPIILHNTSKYSQDNVQLWWDETFHTPMDVRMNVKNLDICFSMVDSGFGAAIVFGDYYMDEHTLHALPLNHPDGTPFTRQLWFAYMEEMEASHCMHSFLKFMEEHSRSLDTGVIHG